MDQQTNPYVAGAPVTDQRMFFGREDVFRWIEENISGRFSDNMLVVHGQRRVGKTSVLKQLKNRLPEKYIPVFFDFQGRTNTTINQFLYRLAREITRTVEQLKSRPNRAIRGAIRRKGFIANFIKAFLSKITKIMPDTLLL